MVAPRLALVIAALLAGSVPVHGKCSKQPDKNTKNKFKSCKKLKSRNIWKEKAEQAAERAAELEEKVSVLEERNAVLEARCGETVPSVSPTLFSTASPTRSPPTCDTPCTSTALVKFLPPDGTNNFGISIDVAGDTMVVGAPSEKNSASSGAAYVISRQTSGMWVQTQRIVASDEAQRSYFSSDIAFDGNTLLIGSRGAGGYTGAAYIFTLQAGLWVETQKLTAADEAKNDDTAKDGQFGISVAVHGDMLVVGASHDDDAQGSAYIFSLEEGRTETRTWEQSAKLVAWDGAAYENFGDSVAVPRASSPFGDTLVVGAPYDDDRGSTSGSAYIFSLEEGGTETRTWEQSAKLVALDGAAYDFFGDSVAVSPGLVAVGAPCHEEGGSDAGAVYMYTLDTLGSWTQAQKLQASDKGTNAYFGRSVAASDGGTVVVGAPCYDCSNMVGSVYIFSCTAAGACTETNMLRAKDGADDAFGFSVAMSCDTVVIGAYRDDDQGKDSGSVYTFT
eukprot:CAMPEP_0194345442 /NCGR_PEP_ID=MMETSP0171-20130528/104855_1 /TAXON_ID=218684 /ORGANISM="Corethron pennatum, Strain L29A3" /LENGTH=504 /DNA_ID=CAMNT_0039112419 /DNA_START=188 /DNA_END=1700 /DNA_ORIENTATION=-